MIGIVQLSGTVRAVVIAVVVAGFVELPIRAIPCPQDRPAPSGSADRQAHGQLKSAPKKQGAALTEYKNVLYGFCFSLPQDWRGYSIVVSRWQGASMGGGKIVQQGPIIIIRDPRGPQPTHGKTSPSWYSLEISGALFNVKRLMLPQPRTGPVSLGATADTCLLFRRATTMDLALGGRK
jgi:hypothetical protein